VLVRGSKKKPERTSYLSAGELLQQLSEAWSLACEITSHAVVLTVVLTFILAIVLKPVLALVLAFILALVLAFILALVLSFILALVLPSVLTIVLSLILTIVLAAVQGEPINRPGLLLTLVSVGRVSLVLYQCQNTCCLLRGEFETYSSKEVAQKRELAQITGK